MFKFKILICWKQMRIFVPFNKTVSIKIICFDYFKQTHKTAPGKGSRPMQSCFIDLLLFHRLIISTFSNKSVACCLNILFGKRYIAKNNEIWIYRSIYKLFTIKKSTNEKRTTYAAWQIQKWMPGTRPNFSNFY